MTQHEPWHDPWSDEDLTAFMETHGEDNEDALGFCPDPAEHRWLVTLAWATAGGAA